MSDLATELAASGAGGGEIVEAFALVLERSHPDIAQFELYLEAARDPELRDVAAESLHAYAEVAETALRAAGVAEPQAFAGIIVATIDGMGLHRGSGRRPGPGPRRGARPCCCERSAAQPSYGAFGDGSSLPRSSSGGSPSPSKSVSVSR